MQQKDVQFEELILKQMKATYKKKIKGPSQLTEEEYRYIASLVKDSNFLVFGTGYDSNIWRYVNKNGSTIFLEYDSRWINLEDTDVFKVEYTCKMPDYKILLQQYKDNNFKNLQMNLPNIVENTNWDYIFVDSPNGGSQTSPGRMQSLYAAKRLASTGTEIFVHDCNREVEDLYSTTLFSCLIKQLTKLRHYKE